MRVLKHLPTSPLSLPHLSKSSVNQVTSRSHLEFWSLKVVSPSLPSTGTQQDTDDVKDVLNVPSIILPRNASYGPYAAFMVDPTTSIGTFLHWFQPNLILSANGTLTIDVVATNASTAIGASYIYPQPPADGYAHQYVILLYQQPPNWAVPSNYSRINPPADVYARFPFDMADFQRAAGLSEPVGTDYFRVLNGTAEQTSSLAGATPSATMASGSASATATAASKTGNAAPTKGVHDLVVAGWAGILALPMIL